MWELPDGFHSHGIDVSHYQGVIDWDKFHEEADSIVRFVYCKATEGTNHIDAQWSRNKSELRKYKIHFGAYHFFLPKKNALKQAKHYVKNYTPRQSELSPVLDVETEGKSDADLISRMKTWLSYVEKKTGRRPIIYTSFHFYSTKFKGKFKGYKFWIANYNNRPDRMVDKQIIHWQYSDHGRIPGIEGPVDLNFSKIGF